MRKDLLTNTETTPKLYVYMHDGKIKKVIISKKVLDKGRVISKICDCLNISRLPKKRAILTVDCGDIIDEYAPAVEVRKKMQSIKSMTSGNPKSVSPVSSSSRKNEKLKNNAFQLKLRNEILGMKSDLNHEKKQKVLLDEKFKAQDIKIKELESINIANKTERKKIEEQFKNEYLSGILRKYIESFLKKMSITPSEDLKLLNDRFRNFNSLQELLSVLAKLALVLKPKWDKVDGTLSWYKIRDQGLGHFGDDARVRIYYCLKTHKLRLCYKENEKYEKRFEKNLDK